MSFADKTVLVTGAASGIGAATARVLAQRGAGKLLLVDKDAAALASLDLPGKVERIAGDVSDPELWAGLTEPLDGALVNAGIGGDGAPVAELTFENWRKTLQVNLDGAFLSLQAALRLARDGAAIVLTASVLGLRPQPGTAAYGVSKAGVVQLARIAAKEATARRIRVNAIAPGGVDTAIWDGQAAFQGLVAQLGGNRDAAIAQMGTATTPFGRWASADEIAGQIAFLLSDEAAFITGSVLVSDGGYTL